MKPILSLLVAFFIIICPGDLLAGEVYVFRGNGLTVLFESPLEPVAREVAQIYPQIKEQLENTLGWGLDLQPSVLLLKDRKHLWWANQNPLIAAFAVPEKGLIVIDNSKMGAYKNGLENTFKHELCHLLLHYHINRSLLSRWLDEGVCQWISDGPGEIMVDQKRSRLNRAAVTGRYIRLRDLRTNFPSDKESLLLAYEQSKDIVKYMVKRFGKEGLKDVLMHMKKGKTVDIAIFQALSIRLDDFEREWHDSLGSSMTWYIYLSYYLYEILFALAALTTIYAFIRLVIRKRTYMREEGGDNP